MMKATLLVFLLVLSACVKQPELKADYGPAVSISDIQKAAFSMAPPDPYSIRKGQFISMDEYQVVDSKPPTTFFQRSDEVTAISEDSTTVKMSFKVNLQELDAQGQWKTSTQPYNLTFLKSNSVAEALAYFQTLNTKNESEVQAYTINKLRTLDATKPKVTYHNLKSTEGTFDTPGSVLSKPNCGNITNCKTKMRYTEISFDRVVWSSDDIGEKTSIRYIYSPDMPTYIEDWTNEDGIYFTNLYKSCAQVFKSFSQGGQSQVVPILGCAEIRDFQFGAP
jgi:hypothetical protein